MGILGHLANITEENERFILLNTDDITKKIEFNLDHYDEIENFFNTSVEDRIVLLHSVRGAKPEESDTVESYIQRRKDEGKAIYIPKLFNFQQDKTGGRVICNTMKYIIAKSGTVAIGYNPESEGTKFDYGMYLYLSKFQNSREYRLKEWLINQRDGFDDPLYNWMRGLYNTQIHPDENNKMLKKLINGEKWNIHIPWDIISLKLEYTPRPEKDGKAQPPALTMQSAISLGMAFAAFSNSCFFEINNVDEVRAQSELENSLGLFKSYSKVALQLHEESKGAITTIRDIYRKK